MRTTRALTIAIVSMLLLATACSSESHDTATATSPTTTAKVSTATWEKVVAPSSCMCSDGSEFDVMIHRGDPRRVLFYLEGGGACFSAETCGPAKPTFTRNLDGEKMPTAAGIFDLSNADNPFADYSMVFVPYCTGDVHLGNATHDYGDGVIVHHNGYINASTALAATAAAFPGAAHVVVAGTSAGSAGAPLYGGLAHDVLPKATVQVLADSSGAYPATPAITAAIGALWGTANAIPRWPENKGIVGSTWTLPGLFVQSGKHDPSMTFARHDYAYDATQATFAKLAGIPADDLVSLIDDNEKMVESKGVKLHSWVAPGTKHTVIEKDGFYTEKVNGTSLRDWVADFVAGKDVPDVHCTECHAD